MEQIHFSDFPNIVSDVAYCDGQPRIKGTRITVAALLSYMAGGMTMDEILAEYSILKKEDIFQAIGFASTQLRTRYIPLKSRAA